VATDHEISHGRDIT
jgi:hypothetical protein